MSHKGYDMYFDVLIYSKKCIRDIQMQDIHVEMTISPGLT